MAHWIIAMFPAHQVYCEPFGGAASVLLQKPRSIGEIYNDLDDIIVGLFRVLQDPVTAEALRRRLHLTPFARAEFFASYRPTDDPVEAAARLVIRSFMGYGSDSGTRASLTGFRACASRSGFMSIRNKDGYGRNPSYDWAGWPDCVPAFVERLRGVLIENRPALEVIAMCDSPATLHYLDPPYVLSTRERSTPGHGYRHEMSDADHELLAGAAHALTGMVLLSGYRCDLYDRLYADWERVDRKHRVQGGRRSVESVWRNQAASEASRVRRLL